MLGSLVFQILCKINNSETFFHKLASNAFYPTWNRSRKKAKLQLLLITHFSNVLQDSINILFEAKLQHLVSLIENHRLESFEIYISSLDVIQNSACCTNKDVNTLSQLSDLLINIDASINCNKSEFIFMMLQFEELVRYLESQFTRGCQNDSREPSTAKNFLSSQVFN